MAKIVQTYTIKAPISKVWQALTDQKMVSKWTGGPATFENRVGGEFSMWDGDIHGINSKMEVNKLLEEDWYSESTSKTKYKVSFELEAVCDTTKVSLTHDNVADDEMDDFTDGWKSFYFDPIKELLED